MGQGDLNDNFDSNQIIKKVYEMPNVPNAENPNLLRVRDLGGKIVPEIFDEVFLTYVPTGSDGEGCVESASYYLDGNLLVTLNMEYYPDGKIKRVVRV